MESFQAEVDYFLQQRPTTEYVDLIFTDINGTPRGKRIPVDALGKVAKGIALPISTISLDVTGSVVEEAGLGEELGEPDHMCYPIAGSLLPTANPAVAQLMLTMMDASGQAPSQLAIRNVLEDLLGKLHQKGQYPVVALELEFYLVDKQRGPRGELLTATNPSKGTRETDTAVYDVDGLDDYTAFLSDLNRLAAEQKLNTSGALSESAPGQFEINFNHQGDVVNACDQLIIAKRLIRQVAQKHDFDVTFMAKPFADLAGNGQHLHISLMNEAGNNLFSLADGQASPLFKQTLAAMLAGTPASMALLCPNINSYRRFAPGCYVPMQADWGENHRGVALRVPMSNAQNRRIEHRIAGADVNPYLLAAVVLDAVLQAEHFSAEQCPPALSQNAESLPTRMSDALTALAQNELPTQLPKEFVQVYLACKQNELEQFEQYITPLEIEWMLHSA